MSIEVPDGFVQMPTKSPFNLSVGPYFYKLVSGQAVFGLRVEERHCNTAGNLHGGMVNAIADIALGNNIGLQLAAKDSLDGTDLMTKRRGGPIATVSMSTDFFGTAQNGDWVEIDVDVQRTGRNLAFANAFLSVVKASGIDASDKESTHQQIARVSAVFKVMR